ncbi:MBOAT family protein [Arcobacter sp. F2176]|uniref:MBOAT family O-acyltransferase n=1 Tax=Arcobacter sp. F2176 TaxID=2044511 RepID=UPI00100A97EE|nr:MBOAT family O-acyltransferase [Arcobacter sp. F2176]RXJ78445.1 membrane-bound O-acyltransferase family protein [Arcobacter sp. F2176]
MIFNSLDFVIFFFIFFGFYLFIPKKIRYIFVLVSSYYFYTFNGSDWIYLILGLTIFVYSMGLLITRFNSYKKLILISTLSMLLIVLAYYKYREFIYFGVLDIFDLQIADFKNIKIYDLPLAISFFTFEFIHYIVDVYKGSKPIKNFFTFALFPAFFPTMIAGPIKRYQDFTKQLQHNDAFSLKSEYFSKGFYLILTGLFVKIVFSDYICLPIVDKVYGNLSSASNLDILLAMVGFSFQIFYDFAGYSLIAIGLAKLMGIDIPINFNSPYLAVNVSDFWKRWHITLSQWLRDYLYIPLGGSRTSKIKVYRNLLITMTLGGLWHGAGLNFIIWGMLHGIALVVYHYYSEWRKINIVPNNLIILKHTIAVTITFIFVTCTWVFFRLDSFYDAMFVFNKLLSVGSYNVLLVNANEYKLLFIVGLFTFIGPIMLKKIELIIYELLYLRVIYLNILLLIILVTIPLFKNPVFIYFKF